MVAGRRLRFRRDLTLFLEQPWRRSLSEPGMPAARLMVLTTQVGLADEEWVEQPWWTRSSGSWKTTRPA